MDRKGNLSPLVNKGNHNCFGCSSINSSGLQMKFFTDGEALFSWLTVPSHLCGWDDLAHGGVLAAILDEIMSWTAIHFSKKFSVTRTISCEFLKSVNIGEEIRVEGRVLEFRANKEATVEGRLYKAEDTLCVKGVGTFRLFTVEAMARLGSMKEEMIKKFNFMIE